MRPISFGKGADATAGAERVAQEDLGDRAIDLHRPLLRILARDPADRGARPHQAVLRRVDQVDGQRALGVAVDLCLVVPERHREVAAVAVARSEERRVGKEWVSPGGYPGSPYHKKK